MSAQPPADYGGGLVCFLTEWKDKGFHLQPIWTLSLSEPAGTLIASNCPFSMTSNAFSLGLARHKQFAIVKKRPKDASSRSRRSRGGDVSVPEDQESAWRA